MNTVRQLVGFLTQKMLLGFGEANVKLCRRGINVQNEIDLVIPVEGEQVSEDGKTVYLSGRLTEEQQ